SQRISFYHAHDFQDWAQLPGAGAGVRIENIEATPVRCPLGRRLRSTQMRRQHRDVVVTRLRTTGGLEGYCFNSVSGTHPGEVVRVIEEEIAPALRGFDLFAT